MKTSLSIFTIALMLGILFSPLRAQSNKKVIRNEAVADFSSIRLQAVGDIFFTQSDEDVYKRQLTNGSTWDLPLPIH